MDNAFNSFNYSGPKQNPLASRVVDGISWIVGSGGCGGMWNPTIITVVGFCSSIQVIAIQPTLFAASKLWLISLAQAR